MNAFTLGRLPRIVFANGCLAQLPEHILAQGRRTLLVTGAHSWKQSTWWAPLQSSLQQAGIQTWHCCVEGEPLAHQVDAWVKEFRLQQIEVVVGIGGGSALDAAKAIAGLLQLPNSVMDFLEGVGPELSYPGPAVPLIAVPTTAGTGSEATRNAVLSQHGQEGFKKSFRDEQLIADLALIDPDLLASCPQDVIAANGMDAITQLIESYVSLRADRFQRALCRDALEHAVPALPQLYEQAEQNSEARADMAYAALISGINLAHTGLGSVHGLASPLGAYFPIPHGVACGTLLAEATALNITALAAREPHNPALKAYAEVAELVCGQSFNSQQNAHQALIQQLRQWQEQFGIERLGHFGIGPEHIDHLVANARGSSMKTNPIVLSDAELADLLRARI